MDAVAGLLHGPRARGAFLSRSSLDPPWSLWIEDEAPLTVVAILRGHACVVPQGGEMMRLKAGDVAIARGPEPYLVADDPDTPVQADVPRGREGRTPEGQDVKMMDFVGIRTWGNSLDGETIMMCGTYQLEGEVPARLLRALPQMLVLDQAAIGSPLVPLLADEIVKDAPGQEAVLDRLLDLLLIATLRAWFSAPKPRPRAGTAPTRPDRRPRPAHAPQRPGGAVDGGEPGALHRRLARRARAPLQRPRGRAADELPHRLADRARRRPPARAGRDGRLGRPPGRLRLLVRPLYRL